jgi:hypothetical protein
LTSLFERKKTLRPKLKFISPDTRNTGRKVLMTQSLCIFLFKQCLASFGVKQKTVAVLAVLAIVKNSAAHDKPLERYTRHAKIKQSDCSVTLNTLRVLGE